MISFYTNNLREFNRFFSTCVVLSFLFVSGANAAILNVVEGQLVGASNVNVSGTFYDVNFVDGTCIELYSGCDEVGDFDFGDPDLASAAAHALLYQVLIDGPDGQFNSDPGLTAGCENDTSCYIVIPHTINNVSPVFYAALAHNVEVNGVSSWSGWATDYDFGTNEYKVFAQFSNPSAVPVPASFWLFGTALIGLAGFKKRQTTTDLPRTR